MHRVNRYLGSLKESVFVKNVILITGGTVFAQGLSILLSPVITRLYTPEDYGSLTVYVALLGIISLLGALSYESAIPLTDTDNEAFNVMILCFSILFFITLILFLAFIFWGDYLLVTLKSEIIQRYKYFIPFGFLLTGIYTVLSQWAFRKKDFKSITLTKYSQSVTGNATKIVFGLFTKGAVGLVLGSILSQSAGILTLTKSHITEFKKLSIGSSYKEIKRLSIRYIRFPLFTAPGLLVLTTSGQLPTIFLSSLFGGSVVGLYGFARSISFLPMTIIGKSIQDVFYGEAASIGRSNPARIKELSNMLLRNLIMLAIVPLSILLLFGPFLFSFIFGENWKIAGVFARILTIEVFFHFIFHPISMVFSIFEQQRKSLLLYLTRLLIVLAIFWLAKFWGLDSFTTVTIYSISMAFVELLKYILAQKVIENEIEKSKSRI